MDVLVEDGAEDVEGDDGDAARRVLGHGARVGVAGEGQTRRLDPFQVHVHRRVAAELAVRHAHLIVDKKTR